MKLFSFFLILVTLMTLSVACNNAPTNNNQTTVANTQPNASQTPATTPSAISDEVALGRADYAQFCIRCHKPDGSGGLFELEDGKKLKVPSLREGHALKHTDQELSKQINNGGDGMPAFKNKLDQHRIDELIRFIHKEFQGQSAPNSAGTHTSAH